MHVPDLVAYSDYLRGRGLADNTVRNYTNRARLLVRWCVVMGHNPTRLEPHHVREWAEQIVPRTHSSRKLAESAIRHWCRWQGIEGCDDAIPVPRAPRRVSRALTRDEAVRLSDAALMVGGHRGVATLCGLYLAARVSEVAALRWDGWSDGRFRFWRQKNQDWHVVPVHPVLAAELGRYRKGASSYYLFPGTLPRPHVVEATVWSWVRQVGAMADVKVTTHQLRATALTTALEASRDLRTVQELAGHTKPEQTANYIRVDESRLRDVVDGIDYSSS